MRNLSMCAALLTLVAGQAAAAEAQISGGVFASVTRVEASLLDGRCIDVSQYYVSINVAQLQMQRSASWISQLFSASKSLGVKVDVSLRREGDASPSQPFSRSVSL